MKVFATDLDGTLVHNKKVTETDREAIAAFQKENLFGVCTGRPLSCLYDVEGIPFDFYIMCTGALLLDKDRHVIEEHLLDKELVRDIYNHYRDYSNIIVQTESESHFYFTDFIDFPTFTMIKDFEEIKDSKFYSISLVFDTGSLTVVSIFSLTKSLKTLIISMLLSFFIVKFVKLYVGICRNVWYNSCRR